MYTSQLPLHVTLHHVTAHTRPLLEVRDHRGHCSVYNLNKMTT